VAIDALEEGSAARFANLLATDAEAVKEALMLKTSAPPPGQVTQDQYMALKAALKEELTAELQAGESETGSLYSDGIQLCDQVARKLHVS